MNNSGLHCSPNLSWIWKLQVMNNHSYPASVMIFFQGNILELLPFFSKLVMLKKKLLKILRGKHTATFRQRLELSLRSHSFTHHDRQCCSLLGGAPTQYSHPALWGVLWSWGMDVSPSPKWLFNQEHTSLFASASGSPFFLNKDTSSPPGKILKHQGVAFQSGKAMQTCLLFHTDSIGFDLSPIVVMKSLGLILSIQSIFRAMAPEMN